MKDDNPSPSEGSFKNVLSTRLSQEWDKSRQVNCDEKKTKGKGKQFRHASVTQGCTLCDQEVVDEESERFNSEGKQVVENFLNECKHLLFKKIFYVEKMEIKVSMKSNFKRHFECFSQSCIKTKAKMK